MILRSLVARQIFTTFQIVFGFSLAIAQNPPYTSPITGQAAAAAILKIDLSQYKDLNIRTDQNTEEELVNLIRSIPHRTKTEIQSILDRNKIYQPAVIKALGRIWLEEHFREFSPPAVTINWQSIGLESYENDYPATVQEAIKKFQAFKNAFPSRIQKSENSFEWIDPYHAMKQIMLDEEPPDLFQRLQIGHNNGGCSTGEEHWEPSRDLALSMLAVKKGEYASYVVQLLRGGYVLSHEPFRSANFRTFDKFGIRLEDLLAGGAVRSSIYGEPALFLFGTDLAFSYLADIAEIRTGSDWSTIEKLENLSRSIHPGCRGLEDTGFNYPRVSGAEAERKIFKVFEHWTEFSAGDLIHSRMAPMFIRMCRRETIPALKKAILLPQPELRRAAMLLLDQFGEKVELSPVKVNQPYKITLVSGGKPFADAVFEAYPYYEGYSTKLSFSNKVITNSQGIAEVEHEAYAPESATLKSISFHFPHSVDEKSLIGSFNAVPLGDGLFNPINLEFSSLAINLPETREGEIRVTTSIKDQPCGSGGLDRLFLFKNQNQVVLEKILEGTYCVEVRSKGYSVWLKQITIVAGKSSELTVDSKAGADVFIELTYSGMDFPPPYIILSEIDGELKEFKWPTDLTKENQTFLPGMPTGNYVLKVVSGEETRESIRKQSSGEESVIKEYIDSIPDYPSSLQPFSVDGRLPVTVKVKVDAH